MLTFKQTNLVLGSFSLILLASCIQVDAQFFTKSSKSIPRMGRRSDNSVVASQQKHQLIDSLIDEYGPQFVAALEGKSMEQVIGQMPSGEVVFRNDQPFDMTRVGTVPIVDPVGYELVGGTRNERSPSQGSSFKDSSLAMRAFNLNKLIHHLASGGQPLTSYDKFFNNGQYRAANGGRAQSELEQKLQPED